MLQTEPTRDVPLASRLGHLALYPDVQHALDTWRDKHIDSVLIGSLAMSMYGPPRPTFGVGVLCVNPPPRTIRGFVRTGPFSFEENITQVAVKILTSDSMSIPVSVVHEVFRTAITLDGMKVASREGMIALKCYGWLARHRRRKDEADLETLLGKDTVLGPEWELTDEQRQLIETLKSEKQCLES